MLIKIGPLPLRQVENVLSSPGIEFRQFPAFRFHWEVLVPRPRFAHAEFGNEDVHIGIELDKHLIRIVVITG